MRHVLVSSAGDDLVTALREAAGPSTTFLAEHGVDATLERLGRSFRIDAVVTDDAAVYTAIREEIPGRIAVYVVPAGEPTSRTLAELERMVAGG